MEMLRSLWALYPGEVVLCALLTLASGLGLAVCIPALVVSGWAEEDETWQD